MANDIKAFGSIERAVLAFLRARFAARPDIWVDADDGSVGGDLSFDPAVMDWYVRIDKIPGGTTDRFQGDFVVEVEVFGKDYLLAESRSLDIEAAFLGYPHVVEVEDQMWVFDTVSQNVAPDELPWEDDEVSRLGATYVITARRR